MLEKIRHFHFVGIGGSGMSAIAKVLLEKGYVVSGSDMSASEMTQKLARLGAKIFAQHQAENIAGAEALVVSTAIAAANPEIVAAKAAGIPVYHRSDLVAALMNQRTGIAVAGAHGKTTTTSMIALMMEHGGLDPAVIIGGELDYIKGNAKWGNGRFLVAEADESDGSFLKFAPKVAVVTNIENDHMDYYHTMENVLQAFRTFLQNLSPVDGLAVVCLDNEHVRDLLPEVRARCLTYGLQPGADYTACNLRTNGAQTLYDIHHKGKNLGTMRLHVPGEHNVLNSLAAVIVGLESGLTFEQIVDGMGHFYGAKRRFQTKARLNGVWIVDDYAHHPTEIISTLAAARQTEAGRLICVFQPHRFSRTQLLLREFGGAFSNCDVVILTDIYAAGEAPRTGVSGEVLRQEVERQLERPIVYIPEREKIARYLAETAESGDLIMTMGAGDIYRTGEELIELLTAKQPAGGN
ncbi:UDP-N-acetylmuramate--L-alanine ligase [Azotosporobacter soli]|uniref:UDP-N-acetylmuramate--L-alanine ligase n=1 Tax=Azotosporobacter soli TaxID=3055040 RepID=UPI0031FE9D1F